MSQCGRTITEKTEQIWRQEKEQSSKKQFIDEFSTFCVDAQKSLENPTPKVKQEVLRLLVESIVIEGDAITIKHIIPVNDNSRLLPRGNMQKYPICPPFWPTVAAFNKSSTICCTTRSNSHQQETSPCKHSRWQTRPKKQKQK